MVLVVGPATVMSNEYLFISTAKGTFIYKVTGGPGEFMGGHHKNTCLLGGGAEIKILNSIRQ